MIGIIDYGMGNLRSVEKAFEHIGAEAAVSADAGVLQRADKLVLPGVGAFPAAGANLRERGLDRLVQRAIAAGRPFLGICLGLQLLFDGSTEMGGAAGLGVLAGRVVRFGEGAAKLGGVKVPHMGWNSLCKQRPSRLLEGVGNGESVYFVHSFVAEPEDESVVAAVADHGGPFCCAVECGNVWATQFHPEKSGSVGLRILQNFAGL